MNEQPDKFITSLNDDIAGRAEWTPLVSGGASFRTHELVEITETRVEFRQTLSDKVFSILLLFVGLGSFGGGVYVLITSDKPFMQSALLLIPFGLFFLSAAVVQIFYKSQSRTFDLDDSWFWSGKRPPNSSEAESRADCVRLEEVHAIQILREKIRTSKSKYSSYEINLILQNGSRINVIDHGDLNATQSDAKRLGEFLDVPVWDVSRHAFQTKTDE